MTQEAINQRCADLNLVPADWFAPAVAALPDPAAAMSGLERWLVATTRVAMFFDDLQLYPIGGRDLMMVFSISASLTDCIVQNPELAGVILSREAISSGPVAATLRREGESLLATAISYRHALDRLRFLRQSWNLRIVQRDLSGEIPQPVIWHELSVLAEVIIELTSRTVWEHLHGKGTANPVATVGFGKLGGEEINYSSDVDLAFFVLDSIPAEMEKGYIRYCQEVSRALSDRMGRGCLYRVDLRLRPYGSTGDIIRTLASYGAYYRLYAEPWEVLAMVRSRVVAGPQEAQAAWDVLRGEICFERTRSDVFLDSLAQVRDRIEAHSVPHDIKRGAGGIRDIEFFVQILSLVHGKARPALRGRPTLECLTALRQDGIISPKDESLFAESYQYLRKLEHRIQLLDDQQSHQLPSGAAARHSIAWLMGFADDVALEAATDDIRAKVRTRYREDLSELNQAETPRRWVLNALGERSTLAESWLDALPHSEDFYHSLQQNDGSLDRLQLLIQRAPALVEAFRGNLTLTEDLISGEIEEEVQLSFQGNVSQLASRYISARARTLARWVLAGDFPLRERLTEHLEDAIRACAGLAGYDAAILALGSFALQDISPASDADLCLVSLDGGAAIESRAEEFSRILRELRKFNAPLHADFRLRPDGGKGPLVRSIEGLYQYSRTDMEVWERFALGQARSIFGGSEAVSAARDICYVAPLTAQEVIELAKMKQRIENERVSEVDRRRNLKLGFGGLSDIEWLIHVQELKEPRLRPSATDLRISTRIDTLARSGLLNVLEAEVLRDAHTFLQELRTWVQLQGNSDDLLPENPSKLKGLAELMMLDGGDGLLVRHQKITTEVRALYLQTMERLSR